MSHLNFCIYRMVVDNDWGYYAYCACEHSECFVKYPIFKRSSTIYWPEDHIDHYNNRNTLFYSQLCKFSLMDLPPKEILDTSEEWIIIYWGMSAKDVLPNLYLVSEEFSQNSFVRPSILKIIQMKSELLYTRYLLYHYDLTMYTSVLPSDILKFIMDLC